MMVAVTGVEPVTFRVWTERSSQLSYTATFMVPEAESNHRHGDFQSPALPTELSGLMAERVGFEPTVPLSIIGFQDQLLKPLGHLSVIFFINNTISYIFFFFNIFLFIF